MAIDLTPAQLRTLRARLEEVQSELVARLGAEEATARQGERLSEPVDAAEQTREQDDSLLFASRDRELLGEVQHALAKLETGRYGLSEVSGRPIEFRRLEALPWTRTEADED
jgi:DnaK suppressor protein